MVSAADLAFSIDSFLNGGTEKSIPLTDFYYGCDNHNTYLLLVEVSPWADEGAER